MQTNTIIDNADAIVIPLKKSVLVSGKDLINMPDTSYTYLWGKFIQTDILCALTGSSDVGKSTILRQLGISIALKKSEFLGYPLNVKHGKVIYLSTEDGRNSMSNNLKKQLGDDYEQADISGLGFLFDVKDPLKVIKDELKLAKYDLIIIDCFGDFFNGDINNSTVVRKSLEPLKRLCIEHECACIVLHHTGKRTENGPASKNNILGSTAFEGLMRVVLELRKEDYGKVRKLHFTKGNYINEAIKKQPLNMNFNENMIFSINEMANVDGTAIKGKVKVYSVEQKEAIIEAATSFREDGLSLDDTLDALNEMDFNKVPSKGTLHAWLSSKNSQSVKP